MMILLVMLIVVLIPTSLEYWVLALKRPFDRENYPEPPASHVFGSDNLYIFNIAIPAECFWTHPYNKSGHNVVINPDVFFTYLMLLISYFWKATCLLRRRHASANQRHQNCQKLAYLQSPWFKRRVLGWLLLRARCHAKYTREANMLQTVSRNVIMTPNMKTIKAELAFRLALITYAGCLATYDFLASFLASLWMLVLMLV